MHKCTALFACDLCNEKYFLLCRFYSRTHLKQLLNGETCLHPGKTHCCHPLIKLLGYYLTIFTYYHKLIGKVIFSNRQWIWTSKQQAHFCHGNHLTTRRCPLQATRNYAVLRHLSFPLRPGNYTHINVLFCFRQVVWVHWHLSASIAILHGPNKNTRSESYFESWRQFIAIMLSAGRAWDWFLIQPKQQQKTTQHIQRENNNNNKKATEGVWANRKRATPWCHHIHIRVLSSEATTRRNVTDSEVMIRAEVQGMGTACQWGEF